MPPPTDHGDIGPVWYSFDLVHKRVEEGGWTHEVNSNVLPTSKDLAGVNMRLTAGSFRELHWHTADEWAIMLNGNARVTVMNPDGTMFIDDVSKGDLWLFPAGFPHSIQGLRPNGCEFLLVWRAICSGLFTGGSWRSMGHSTRKASRRLQITEKWGNVMATQVRTAVSTYSAPQSMIGRIYERAARLDRVGMGLLRLGLIIVLCWIGGLKFAEYEGEGIV